MTEWHKPRMSNPCIYTGDQFSWKRALSAAMISAFKQAYLEKVQKDVASKLLGAGTGLKFKF
jgi:hypothetical protein